VERLIFKTNGGSNHIDPPSILFFFLKHPIQIALIFLQKILPFGRIDEGIILRSLCRRLFGGTVLLGMISQNNIPRLFASVYDVETAGKTAAELLSIALRFSESRNVMVFTDDIFRFSQKRIQTAFCAEAEKAGLSVIGRHEVKSFHEKQY